MPKSPLLKVILLFVALAAVTLIGLVAAIATRPAEFTITRSTRVHAPPGVVFDQVNDFHRWEQWSPWAKLDPAMKLTYSGPEAGEGAVYEWSGNNDVGEGRMTVVESRPGEVVRIKLEFLKPMAAVNSTEFAFEPSGAGTQVVWTMSGTNDFMGKAFSLFVNMDEFVGGDFEKGLAQLKSLAESTAKESGDAARVSP